MNKTEKNAVDSKAVATKMVKKAIKNFNEGNRGCVTEMIKIEKGVRFRVDGWVNSDDDDTCKYGVIIKPQIIEGRAYRDYAQTTKTICNSIEREKAFGAFYEAVIETISNAIDQIIKYEIAVEYEMALITSPYGRRSLNYLNEIRTEIEEWVEEEKPLALNIWQSEGVVEAIRGKEWDEELSTDDAFAVRRTCEEYYKDLMSAKVKRLYGEDADCDAYRAMLKKKWEYENSVQEFQKSVKNDRPMLDELVENDTPMLEDDEITDKEKPDMTIRELFEREYDNREQGLVYLREYADEFLTGQELDDFRKMAPCTDGCYLELGENEDGDMYVCGNESAYKTYYDDDYPIVDVYRDMMENMKKEIDDFFKKDNDRELGYRVWSFDNHDAYMKIVNYGWDYGLKFDIGTDGYRGDYVDVA